MPSSQHRTQSTMGRGLAAFTLILLAAVTSGDEVDRTGPAGAVLSSARATDPVRDRPLGPALSPAPQLGTTGRPVPPGALHVATRGSDRASGSSRSPLRSIEEAVRRAERGDTVVVHSGAYHESVKIEQDTGVTLMGAPGAEVWLDGSREVRSWASVDRLWVAEGWTAQFDASPTYAWGAPDNTEPGWQFVNPEHPMAAHPDQVWIDDVPQRQVGLIADVRPGTFYVDEDSDRLYLGSDPTGREVRASDLAKAISIRAAGTRILGIGVRRFASSVPHMGSVTVEAPRVRLEDMVVQENATTGVHVLGRRARLTRVALLDNGMMGLTTTGADGLRLDRLHVAGNNREQFNPSPAAGGVKIGRGTDVVVRDSVFDRNRGTGLWFDESVLGISVLNSRLTRNAAHGISLELSGRALVAGNVLAHNGGAGLKVNDTSHVAVWNNTFTDNDREINIVQDDRDLDSQGSYLDETLPLTFRNGPVVIANNVLAGTAPESECLVCVEDYSGRMSAEQMGVSLSGNLYQRAGSGKPRSLVLWSTGDGADTFGSLRDFQEATGQEDSGRLLVGVRVLTHGARVTDRVDDLASRIARRLPKRVAAALGAPQETRRLGAW